ncbi:MAG TPA: hypothetical protein VMF08_17600 [Candidatus Sulfotelmatobacter sp.]|nr:hypothetical protein [Candidatus Sulfotelmatobacter sp.]
MIALKIGYIGYIAECQRLSRQHFGNTKSNKSYIIVIVEYRIVPRARRRLWARVANVEYLTPKLIQ